VELAGSLVAVADWLETGAGCKSAVLSSFKPTRSPSPIERSMTGLFYLAGSILDPACRLTPSSRAKQCSDWT
jgi:hypothetical protein